MELFSENLGEVETDEELASLQQQFPYYDLGYITQSAGSPRRREKDWIEKLWKQYAPYADSHFIEDFKRQFAERSWELYLGATLLNRGFRLGRHNNAGPDFDVQNNKGERLTWIEATVTEKGKGKDRVPEMIYEIAIDVPEEEMLLRVSNALDEKFKRYQTELTNGVVKDNEPYVIAVNRSPLNHVDPGLPLILKALFGIGHQALRIIAGGVRQTKPESFWTNRPKIGKRSGKDVPMLFFDDPTYSGISAIVYCADSILNSPRISQEMGENFVAIHNPLAKNLLPEGFFPFGDEYKAEGEYVKKIREGKKWNKPNLF
jgi:type I restriction enzyme S subunit